MVQWRTRWNSASSSLRCAAAARSMWTWASEPSEAGHPCAASHSREVPKVSLLIGSLFSRNNGTSNRPCGPRVSASAIAPANRAGSPDAASAMTLYSSLLGQYPR